MRCDAVDGVWAGGVDGVWVVQQHAKAVSGRGGACV